MINAKTSIIGKKFGRLTVIKFHHREAKYRNLMNKDGTFRIGGYKNFYVCKCDCGSYKIINEQSLKRGLSKSCGCLFNELRKKGFHKKHGKTDTRLYNIWCSMKQRCYNPNYLEFKYWGGKGVQICEEWRNDFGKFYDWAINNGYRDDLSIDRINGNLNYCPENCRWATAKEQANNQNKPKHHLIKKEVREKLLERMNGNIYASKYIIGYNNEKYPLKRFCEKYNKSYDSALNWVKENKNLSKFFGFDVILERKK